MYVCNLGLGTTESSFSWEAKFFFELEIDITNLVWKLLSSL